MTNKRPSTVSEYIDAAPTAGQAHLRQLYALLESVAPEAEQVLKWGTPFFVEPRFVFAFSAHKAHLGFTPMLEGLEPFRAELGGYAITAKGILKIRYDQALPVDVIRRIAEARVAAVAAREDDGFW